MKLAPIFLLLLGLALQPLNATGLPPGFAEEDEEEQEAGRERAEVDYQRLLLKAMLEQVDEEEILELELDAERSFISLYREALRPDPKGRVLLLPADGHHPNWPEAIGPLRKRLADFGWHTLALSLPQYRPLGPAVRTLPPGPLLMRLDSSVQPSSASEQEEEAGGFPGAFEEEQEETEERRERADPRERLAEQQAAVAERLQAAFNFLETGGRQVLVLQGESIFWLLPWLEAGNKPDQLALVLVHVKTPEGATNADLNRLLRALGDRPLLDIYDGASLEQARNAEQRRAAYARAGNGRAVQLNLEATSGWRKGSRDAWLGQRVEGWLRSLD